MAEFSYDAEGSNTIIFILAALVLYLAPTTFWKVSDWLSVPQGLRPGTGDAKFKELCERKKRSLKKEKKGFGLSNAVYIAAWILFFFMLYKASGIDAPKEEVWNPYTILGLDPEGGATEKQIKSAYRKLSVQLHPDKNPGNESAHEIYMQVVKAHQTLTDEATRENWEKYGHPDGKRAVEFGIALPAWMVGDEYKWLVLAVYFVGIMVVLPVVVATWSWNSKKYTRDRILRQTINLYYQYLRPQMAVTFIIEILSGSVEFLEQVPQRPNDAEMLEPLKKKCLEEIPGLSSFLNGETKFNAPYVLKAKTLLWAHMLRIGDDAMSPQLRHDQAQVLSLSSHLLQGMINMASLRRWVPLTITCMHAHVMLVQALVDEQQPRVFQLPYVDDELFKQLDKFKCYTIQDYIKMDPATRRKMMEKLTDQQYVETVTVANNIPFVDVEPRVEVAGEDKIYTNSLITVKATLTRLNWLEVEAKQKARMEEAEKKKNAEEGADEKEESKDGLRQRKGSNKKGAQDDEDDDVVDTNKKERIFKEKIVTHPVHCPYWPMEKQEGWWMFLADQRHQLIGHPQKIDDLIDTKEVELFIPPVSQTGQYRFMLWLISDSYMGCDSRSMIEFDAVEAPAAVVEEEVEEDLGAQDETRAAEGAESDVESELESDFEDE